MEMFATEAWVLHRSDNSGVPLQLVRETFNFPGLDADEVLATPLYGCWEGNMDHALRRSPIDIGVLRNEDRVVIGNAGVVRVERVGSAVKALAEGDLGIVFCNGTPDANGYPTTILGYDAPGTMGVLAKTMKLREGQLLPIPKSSPLTLDQWAAFSLRYITAWANWHVAWGCWQTQMREVSPEEVFVCGWGGGVSFAQLLLAKSFGCRVAMIASTPSRLSLLRSLGIEAIDRSAFDKSRFEEGLLSALRLWTGGRGVSIFIDNIGSCYRSTLKAIGRQGVITTSGWKHGITHPTMRSLECISRHIHVFTHYARYCEGVAAVDFANKGTWSPPRAGRIYTWDEIPELAQNYASGAIDDYFPIFSVNQIDAGGAA